MSKRSRRRTGRATKKRNSGKKRDSKKKQPEKKQITSEPWLSQHTGYRVILLLSLGLAFFMAWQLWPSEGAVRATLWGIGFGAAIWVVFLFSLAFNRWIRGSRKK